MKKILLYIIPTLMLASCSNEIPEHHQPAASKRTLLAYLVANNNLDNDLMDNVKWMYQSLCASPDTCALVVYYKPRPDNPYFQTPQILEFRSDGYGNINGMPGLQGADLTVGNLLPQAIVHPAVGGLAVTPDIMQGNLERMKEIAPSQRYGLIFGSHATGWLKGQYTMDTYAFGSDDNYSINVPELASTLGRSFSTRTLDFILFDACMMGTAEVCYKLKDVTRYCIASAMETPATGFPYHRILNNLYADDIDYQRVCDETVAFNRENKAWGTYAAIDCTQMAALADVIRQELLRNRDALQGLSYHTIQQYGISPQPYFAFDITDFFKQLGGDGTRETERFLSAHVVVAKACIDDCTLSPWGRVLTDGSRFCGLGMYYPDHVGRAEWDAYYKSAYADWYRAAGWQELKYGN